MIYIFSAYCLRWNQTYITNYPKILLSVRIIQFLSEDLEGSSFQRHLSPLRTPMLTFHWGVTFPPLSSYFNKPIWIHPVTGALYTDSWVISLHPSCHLSTLWLSHLPSDVDRQVILCFKTSFRFSFRSCAIQGHLKNRVQPFPTNHYSCGCHQLPQRHKNHLQLTDFCSIFIVLMTVKESI